MIFGLRHFLCVLVPIPAGCFHTEHQIAITSPEIYDVYPINFNFQGFRNIFAEIQENNVTRRLERYV
jgi:hypothetical protein